MYWRSSGRCRILRRERSFGTLRRWGGTTPVLAGAAGSTRGVAFWGTDGPTASGQDHRNGRVGYSPIFGEVQVERLVPACPQDALRRLGAGLRPATCRGRPVPPYLGRRPPHSTETDHLRPFRLTPLDWGCWRGSHQGVRGCCVRWSSGGCSSSRGLRRLGRR